MKGKILIVIFILLCVLGGWMWWWMQGEATGTIQTRTIAEKDTEPKKENFLYTGKYMTVSVPGDFHEVMHTVPEVGPMVESVYLAGGSDVVTEKIALTLEKREEKDFISSPSYQVRKNNPSYTETPYGEGVLLEKKSAPYELNYFFWWEGYLVDLTYTAPQEKSTTKSVLQEMQTSLLKPLEGEKK